MNQPLSAEEIWALFAETDRLIKANSRSAEQRFQEAEQRFQATEQRFQETDRRFQETQRLLKESGQEVDRRLKESGQDLDRRLKELGRQLGGLGNKFGSFTEGLALPSMEKLLRERFGMTVVSPRVKVITATDEVEIDLLAYANGTVNSAFLVEVKSHLDQRAIQQLMNLLEKFPALFPEHRDKALYGMLACVQGSKELRQQVLDQGLYLATIHDKQFRLDTPQAFIPRRFDLGQTG